MSNRVVQVCGTPHVVVRWEPDDQAWNVIRDAVVIASFGRESSYGSMSAVVEWARTNAVFGVIEPEDVGNPARLSRKNVIEAAERSDVRWDVYGTGGGCECLRIELSNVLEAWITDAEDPSLPDSVSVPCRLGFYRTDVSGHDMPQDMVMFRCKTLAEALAIVAIAE